MTNSSISQSISQSTSTSTVATSLEHFEAVQKIGLPYAVTKKGLYIINFCSGHTFDLHDGTAVPPCESERVKLYAMKITEELIHDDRGFISIGMTSELSDIIESELERVYSILNDGGKQYNVVVLTPLMVINAMRIKASWYKRLLKSPFRTIRSCGRETTNPDGTRNRPPSWADRFCI